MNTRAAAVIAVAALAALAVAAVSPDSDAEVTESMSLEIGDVGSTMLIHLSESQYATGYDYTLVWSASIDGSSDPGELGSRGLDGSYEGSPAILSDGSRGLTVSLSETSVLGTYELHVSAAEGDVPVGDSLVLVLTATVSIYVEDAADGPLAVLDPFVYRITVTVSDPGELTIGVPGGDAGTMRFTQYGKVDPLRISAHLDGGEEDVVDRYSWYAQGLPDGLSMSPDGYISGFPMVTTPAGGVEVSIVATSADGTAHQASLTVIVDAFTAPDYSGNAIAITVTSGQEGEGDYAAEVGDDFTFTVSFTIDGSPADVPVRVAAVDSGGDAVYLEPDSDGVYSAGTGGTGRYVISASAVHDGVQYIDLVTLTVTEPNPADAHASIVVSSSGDESASEEGPLDDPAGAPEPTHYVYGNVANLHYPFTDTGAHVTWTIAPYGGDPYTIDGEDLVAVPLDNISHVTVTQTVQLGDTTDSETIVIRHMGVMLDDDRTFTVTFVSQGQVWNEQSIGSDVVKLAGDPFFVIPDDPARSGYVFQGWYRTEGGAEAALTDDAVYEPVASDMEFHARWATVPSGDSGGGSQTIVVDRTRTVTFQTQEGLSVFVSSSSGNTVIFTVSADEDYAYIEGSITAVANSGRMTFEDGLFKLTGIDRNTVVDVTGDRVYTVSYRLDGGASVTVDGYGQPPSQVASGPLSMTVSGASRLVVLMNGEDVTSRYADGMDVSIPMVTGNLVVIAEASAAASGDDGGFPWWLILVVAVLVVALAVMAYLYHRRGRDLEEFGARR